MGRVVFVGIDPGIEPAIVIQKGRKLESVIVKNPLLNIHEFKWRNELSRLHKINLFLTELLGGIKYPIVVGVESAALASPFRGNMMGHVDYVLMDCLVLLPNVKFVNKYAPASVKKQVAGNGRASKEEVQAAVFRLYPNFDVPSGNKKKVSDLCDALAVLHCAKSEYRGRV